MSLLIAKSLLRKGATLAFAAEQSGMTKDDLDLALWASLPRGLVKGGAYCSAEQRQARALRMKERMADPVLKETMKRGRNRGALRKFNAAGLTWSEIVEARRLNRDRKFPIDEAMGIVLRSRRAK